MSQDRPELCGAWAGDGLCTMPKGHNMGRLDIPSNHKCEKPVAAQEPITWLVEHTYRGSTVTFTTHHPQDIPQYLYRPEQYKVTPCYDHAAPCARCEELEQDLLTAYRKVGTDQAKITEQTLDIASLLLKVEQFDRAISHIGHHMHLTLAGVDTEEEYGPGGHSAYAICRKFDEQAERIKALEAESAKRHIGLLKYAEEMKTLETKIAKADAVILKCKEAMTWDIGGEPLPTLEIAALAAIEQYQKWE